MGQGGMAVLTSSQGPLRYQKTKVKKKKHESWDGQINNQTLEWLKSIYFCTIYLYYPLRLFS